ncbi:non-homologous end-joining DNA ligase [Rufibacter psychrotolerans]|uniref:non-homologous end-joining DNA ligase n=1 Tax=Rufibacter psychrotolerans TaxID=2812556 RepID=UPI001968350C|nr:non-homologous end-joining DNA ligase [Rufibacter sp. SYSU D00308]
MSLEEYNQKRHFDQTPEPEWKETKGKGALRFVVHRHQASKLHYDFRLELGGVLKSWAVPKGPSLNPAHKRLAVAVEDHPFSYRTFEGDIPEGNYGAGHVAIWDQGTLHAVGTTARAAGEKQLLQELAQGNLHFRLEGEKLQGEFSLVKMKGRQQDAWLLLKKQDQFATEEDYNAEDYVPGTTAAAPRKAPAKKAAPTKADVASAPTQKATKSSKTALKQKPETSEFTLELDGHQVPISNPDKLYWPEEGITKKDLVLYYQAMAPVLLPYLQDRPQSLLRHPNGTTKPGFFQKDAGEQAPDWVETITITAASTGKDVAYLVCQNNATLAYLNNLGCIQLNPWNARRSHLDQPDYLVLDLDPGENTYDEVVETALVAKQMLDELEIPVYAKTSGATGMHLYVPLGARWPFEPVKELAHLLAQRVHQQLPKLTSLERSPKERRHQIYLDYLQNATAQTIAAPYSVRPRPGAPVSTPLDWKEVKTGLHPSQFTIHNVPARVKKRGDLFQPVLGEGLDVAAYLKKLKT